MLRQVKCQAFASQQHEEAGGMLRVMTGMKITLNTHKCKDVYLIRLVLYTWLQPTTWSLKLYHFSETRSQIDSQGQLMTIGGEISTIGQVLGELHHFLFSAVWAILLHSTPIPFRTNIYNLKLEEGGKEVRSTHAQWWSPRRRLGDVTNTTTT